MKKISAKDIQRLESALKDIYLDGDSAPEPSLKWQQNIMREVRSLEQCVWSLPLILKELCWPTAQFAFALIIMIGIYLINDASLTNLDLSLFYTEMQVSSENLISYYSF